MREEDENGNVKTVGKMGLEQHTMKSLQVQMEK